MRHETKGKVKKGKKMIKSLTKEEVKSKLQTISTYGDHPEVMYEQIGKTIALIQSGGEDKEGLEYLKENIFKLDTFSYQHMNLASTATGNISTAMVELANNLIKEYQCETTLEKTLCETIANSYGKIMRFSKRLHSSLEFDYLGKDRNQFISVISKELDRANRMYLMGINNLIEIKRPQMKINLNAENAFFGENQQFNNNQGKDADSKNIKD